MWSLIVLILLVRAKQLFWEKERPPHMQELLPEWTAPPTGCNTVVHQENDFFFSLKPLAHDNNHLNCLDYFKEDFAFNDVTVFFPY